MGRTGSTDRHGKLLTPRSRAEEDFLDWCDNHARSPEDQKRVDRAFCTSWLALTLLWLIPVVAGIGSVVKLTAMAVALFAH